MSNNIRKTYVNEDHCRVENYKQRMTEKDWEKILLNYEDRIIVKGRVMRLVANSISSNIVEVYKAPL